MMPAPSNKTSERGAALLAVLLVATLASVAAVAMMDDLRIAAKRTTNIRDRDQALWHLEGVELVGRRLIERSWRANAARSTLNDPWATAAADFPIDGGRVTGRIRDAGNCFNLNSVVASGGGGRLAADESGAEMFRNLLAALEFDRGRMGALTAALTDWVDSDSEVSPLGAEDSAYMGLVPPYRTAGSLIMDVSELLAIRGFDAATVARLQPYVCVRPIAGPSQININTLTAAQAPLLMMLAGADLSHAQAERVLDRRPLAGFATIGAFWALEELAPFDRDFVRRMTGLTTQSFAIEAAITLGAANLKSITIVRIEAGGQTTIETRRLGSTS